MNRRLIFSWGHIIALIAILMVSYVSFMGCTYLFDGNFSIGIVGMAITDLIFIVFFIGGQQMKAQGEKIWNANKWERLFIFGTPVIWLAGMIVMSHFWTVYNRREEVVADFNEAIAATNSLFNEYEDYAHSRIDNYKKTLDRIIAESRTSPAVFREMGFTHEFSDIQRNNKMTTLRLQLLPSNYTSLQQDVKKWIKQSQQSNDDWSVWNVFLLGNVDDMSRAIDAWKNQLKTFSDPVLQNEDLYYRVEPFEGNYADQAKRSIDRLVNNVNRPGFPTVWAVLFGVLMYGMLILPYFIQQRHGRQVANGYSLFPKGKRNSKNSVPIATDMDIEISIKTHADMEINVPEHESKDHNHNKNNENKEDDQQDYNPFKSFTLD